MKRYLNFIAGKFLKQDKNVKNDKSKKNNQDDTNLEYLNTETELTTAVHLEPLMTWWHLGSIGVQLSSLKAERQTRKPL